MPSLSATAPALEPQGGLTMAQSGSFPGLRVLAWHGSVLYASRGYTLLRADFGTTTDPGNLQWEEVAIFRAPSWRKLMASSRLTLRLCRDGFHSLAVLPSG